MAHERAERVLPCPPRLSEERDRQVVHLRLVRRPERLGVRERTERAEPRQVVGVHDLDVREMMAQVVEAVGRARRLDRVERLAHRAVRERVEVHLEPERVQPRDRLLQELGLDHREPAVVGRVAVLVEVGVERRAREVLADAVLHDLDARGGEPARLSPGAERDQVVDLLETLRPVPPQGADDPAGEVPAAGGGQVRVVVAVVRGGVDDRVLPAGDAERVQVRLALQEALVGQLVVGVGRVSEHERTPRPRAGCPAASRRRCARCARPSDRGCRR